MYHLFYPCNILEHNRSSLEVYIPHRKYKLHQYKVLHFSRSGILKYKNISINKSSYVDL